MRLLTVLTLLLAASAARAAGFSDRAGALLSTGPFAGAEVAAVFAEVESGTTYYLRNSTAPLLPASTAKLATSAAALERLKPDFAFVTTFLAPKGAAGPDLPALVWRGRGDPSISGRNRGSMSEIFDIWAGTLAARGVKSVKRLVLDGRYFDGPAVHPSWPEPELAYWYQAETSAIAFNDNCVDMEFRPAAKPGKKPVIALNPDIGYIKVKNGARTCPEGGEFTLDFNRPPLKNKVTFTGLIPKGKSRKDYVAVHDPARFAAEALAAAWKKRGIKVGKIVAWDKAGLDEGGLEEVFAWRSEPLAKILQVVNTNSQNFYAEQVLKTLARETTGRATFDAGTAVVADYLASIGLAKEEFRVVDGSGLSEDNRFTAAALVKLLRHMYATPHFELYYETLATAKNRMKGDPLAAGMRLKRGTVAHARNLAGYLHSESGKLYAFAVLVNGEKLDRNAVDEGIDEVCLAAAHGLP